MDAARELSSDNLIDVSLRDDTLHDDMVRENSDSLSRDTVSIKWLQSQKHI